MDENKALDLLSKTNWGVEYSKFRAVVSGDIIETYEYERAILSGGKSYKRSRRNRRVSRIRRSFSIRRARLRIRRLISCNIDRHGQHPLFITFTFHENVQDLRQANRKWTDFIRRWNIYAGFRCLYLAVVEFQKRGAVHYHAVFFNLGFFPYGEMIRLWGHGSVRVEDISRVESLGAYVSKYLQKGTVDARLFNEKVYFTSRGLYKPMVVRSMPVDNFVDSNDQGRIMVLQAERRSYTQWLGLIKYNRYKLE